MQFEPAEGVQPPAMDCISLCYLIWLLCQEVYRLDCECIPHSEREAQILVAWRLSRMGFRAKTEGRLAKTYQTYNRALGSVARSVKTKGRSGRYDLLVTSGDIQVSN